MKKLSIIIVLLFMVSLLVSLLVSANLSDDTLKEVEKLRWRNYKELKDYTLIADQHLVVYVSLGSDIEWTQCSLSIWVEGDRLIIKTQDGKWFIEMEKVK